ncbi:MAG: choice-of-anchor D domain-containing protein, partial [Candidatus Krumholzibacteria bacterium]|nr:choice-of-anchor D domain-containing protein [Candidatus Krumholzibacteria bacterium]
CLGIGFPGPARGQDNLGIFWDNTYTQDSTVIDTYPGFLTGYLVLKDPSTPSGLLGWECCVDVDGPGQFTSWALEGNAMNVASPPCFMVGIGDLPLPSDPDVLLATFQIMVTEPLPVILSVRPDYHPSVPGQMSFIPADDPSALLPMTTLSGQPEVAWINGHIPNLEVNPETLHFEGTIIGTQVVKTVTVSNLGAIPGYLDVALTGDCGPYSLPGLSGLVTVPVGESRTIQVAFAPETTEYFECSLVLGWNLADVMMIGNGRDLNLSWTAPTEVDFGAVSIQSSETRTVTIVNTGEASFEIEPFIPLTCPEFTITSGGYAGTIDPGRQRVIYVKFQPTSLDTYSCYLDLGSIVPAVQLTGTGREPTISWDISPAVLEFGSVGLGYSPHLYVYIENTGDGSFMVTPSLPDSCSAFTLYAGAPPTQVDPGVTHIVPVQFTPSAVSEYACSLDLGDLLPDVPITGAGRDLILSWDAPTYHDFGLVGVGSNRRFDFNVTNNGDIAFQIDPSLPDTAQSFQLLVGSSTLLEPGQTSPVSVNFQPVVPGPLSVILDMGSTVPPIQLEGEGDPLPAQWTVSPDTLDFHWLYVGTLQEKTVSITNTGGTFLDLDINLDDPDLGYDITGGAGIYQLAPGHGHTVDVRFQPLTEGFAETNLNLGPQFTPVPVMGAAENSDSVCIIQPDILAFGSLNVGTSMTKTFSVTNIGNQELRIIPHSNSSVFLSISPGRILGTGHTAYFSIVFQPEFPGTFTATIDLGDQACSDVSLSGTAIMQGGVGQNLVGIFFDQDYSYIDTQTSGPNEIVTGYLVLVEPSETTGVGAWELAVDIDGDAQWLSWDLEGEYINVGQYNEFIVGIGGSPLPYSPAVLLATFQLLVAEPYPNVVYLELGPTRFPSLPDNMVWAPWHDASMLMPLYPFTGDRIVAGVNWAIVGIGHPAPRATLTGGAVELQWTVPEEAYDGCHVYRRNEAGVEIRLTDQPLSGYGSTLTFTDRPEGYASGTVLYYSYTVVTGGVEGAHSPETEITLKNIPAVATRLLPNVPNPFNPVTEIRFELARPQRVQVSVYDVTGRLVNVLADGQLGAGHHARLWQGRDSGGRQVPSGAYYVRLVADNRVDHHKIMLLK